MVRHWSEISPDPNATLVKSYRRAQLDRIRDPSYVKSREQYLGARVRGRRVLDVGVVEHVRRASNSQDWLHRFIRDESSYCLGVDILEDAVRELRADGFNVIVHDFCAAPLNERFEVIVCGEVLEHIDNPGIFLRNIARSLADGGHLILSLPNPWYINCFAKNALRGSYLNDSADHVAWYDAETMVELGSRCGLELASSTGVLVRAGRSWLGRLIVPLFPILEKLGVKYELFCKTMIYRFCNASKSLVP